MCPLETSLVEWKLERQLAHVEGNAALETSLVEWKLVDFPTGERERVPLETSLVEWKLDGGAKSTIQWTGLGNFLSGMETELLELGRPFGQPPWKLP